MVACSITLPSYWECPSLVLLTALDKFTFQDRYPLPRIHGLLDAAAKSTFFCGLAMKVTGYRLLANFH